MTHSAIAAAASAGEMSVVSMVGMGGLKAVFALSRSDGQGSGSRLVEGGLRVSKGQAARSVD